MVEDLRPVRSAVASVLGEAAPSALLAAQSCPELMEVTESSSCRTREVLLEAERELEADPERRPRSSLAVADNGERVRRQQRSDRVTIPAMKSWREREERVRDY